MKAKSKEIEFDPQALVARVQEFAAHAKNKTRPAQLRITEIAVPPPVKSLRPAEIKDIRTRLGVSQTAFAALLNVPKNTAVSWESGVRKPSGAALKLLQLVRRKPEILAEA
jgi:putative transcriptional regulator